MDWLREEDVVTNPLADLIDARTYELLEKHNLLNKRGVRDYVIRRKFRHMRQQNMSTAEAIEALREEYPYLQFDTLRKIVYGIH